MALYMAEYYKGCILYDAKVQDVSEHPKRYQYKLAIRTIHPVTFPVQPLRETHLTEFCARFILLTDSMRSLSTPS